MKEYDLIAFGTGSAMNIVEPFLQRRPDARVAVIDKDEPGGICLTRGCIPTKILTYPSEVVNVIRGAKRFGIDATIRKVDFAKVMRRMRSHIDPEIQRIGEGLSQADRLDYFRAPAEFVAPYTVRVEGETLRGRAFLLCTGSNVLIPPIRGIDQVPYHTSDTILRIRKRPATLAIVGGGYIACELGHFFAGMGTKVTIVGRNPRILPDEEPEISAYVKEKLSERMRILTGLEVVEARRGPRGTKVLVVLDKKSGRRRSLRAEEILIASGRGSNAGVLKPEKGGIKTDRDGWIVVNEFLETSQTNVWAFGDATGKHLFKHKANYESILVARQLLLNERRPARYDAVPHAVFTDPEVAAVGLGEEDAIRQHGAENVLVGFRRYGDIAKGYAIGVEDAFVKTLVHRDGRILGAHVVGPQASILIQEVVNLMYAPGGTYLPIQEGMHIHPALSEVVERAFQGLVPAQAYRSHRHEEAQAPHAA